MKNMLNTILIDDEKHSLESLSIEISRHCPEINIIEICKGARSGLRAIREHNPDLIFLDIDMPVMNGFELLEEVRDATFDVIFATAYDEYAVRAIKVSAMDYLLKPVDSNDLKSAVRKVIDKRKQQDSNARLEVLLTNIRSAHDGFQKLAIPTLGGLDFINTSDIVYCEADGSYTNIHTASGDKYVVSKTMKEIAEMLASPAFFRTHQSYLVNLNHIVKYIKGSGGQLVLTDGAVAQVARARKEELMGIIFNK